MASEHGKRINVVLDDSHAAKLHEIAARMYVQPGTIARSLLSTAIDQVDTEATTIYSTRSQAHGSGPRKASPT
jgi:hypothetical protein